MFEPAPMTREQRRDALVALSSDDAINALFYLNGYAPEVLDAALRHVARFPSRPDEVTA